MPGLDYSWLSILLAFCTWTHLRKNNLPYSINSDLLNESFWHFLISISLFLFSCSVASNLLWSHGLQHARLPCRSLSPRVHSNSCPLSQWCHPAISSSVAPFSFCLQSFPASGSFPISQFSSSGDQSIEASASASVLPMNIEGWFPLVLTGLISLLSECFLTFKKIIFLLRILCRHIS